ncbi:MAG: hypothetical protein AMS20_09630 [Gemmatimonas sp. SG8_28]|nr:MAG: hypothetical protein AMS20_09630 [Gemmatimonas sp. SG8_28]
MPSRVERYERQALVATAGRSATHHDPVPILSHGERLASTDADDDVLPFRPRDGAVARDVDVGDVDVESDAHIGLRATWLRLRCRLRATRYGQQGDPTQQHATADDRS